MRFLLIGDDIIYKCSKCSTNPTDAHQHMTYIDTYIDTRTQILILTNKYKYRHSLDDTLALCQERGVADATAYLLERKGDVVGALSLALRTLSTRLSSLRSALQEASLRDVAVEMAFSAAGSAGVHSAAERTCALAVTPKAAGLPGGGLGGVGGGGGIGGGGTSGGPRAGTAAWARWASKVALEGLQEVSELER